MNDDPIKPPDKRDAAGAPKAASGRRLGLMAGEFTVPDDFDRMAAEEIADLFAPPVERR